MNWFTFAGNFISLRNRKRCLTVDEALEYLQSLSDDSSDSDDDEKTDLIIIPPDPDIVTDEEGIDDDLIGVNIPIPKDVSGEIEIISKIKKKNNADQKKKNIVWEKCTPEYNRNFVDIDSREKEKKELLSLNLQNFEPVQMFLQMFSGNVCEHIVQESIRYAHQNNRLKFYFSVSMLKRFVGFLLFTGYSTVPQEKLYWSVVDDISFPLVRSAMSRTIYMGIKQNLHLADNANLDKSDKLAKVRPYLKLLNESFMQHGVFTSHLSIDEQMIPYFGKHSCKMFMKGKPVRFGFKVWCLCSSDGYLYQFDIYTGKSQEKSMNLGLGGDIVTKLLSVVEVPANYVVYFDNFFTSHSLLSKLGKLGFNATGTVRENRIVKCPVIPVKKMKKEARGTYESAFDRENEITVTRWNDNAVVTVATNWDTIEPLNYAKRYSRTEKKHVQIEQPKVIANYNKHMGGVDLLDNFVAAYRINIKGKKWWWAIFTNFIDVAKANAWKLYKENVDPKISLLDFQRAIAVSLLKTPIENDTLMHSVMSLASGDNLIGINNPSTSGRPSAIHSIILNEIKKDPADHLIIRNPENKRRRCKYCSSQTITICSKCNVSVHSKCFKEFHKIKK